MAPALLVTHHVGLPANARLEPSARDLVVGFVVLVSIELVELMVVISTLSRVLTLIFRGAWVGRTRFGWLVGLLLASARGESQGRADGRAFPGRDLSSRLAGSGVEGVKILLTLRCNDFRAR